MATANDNETPALVAIAHRLGLPAKQIDETPKKRGVDFYECHKGG